MPTRPLVTRYEDDLALFPDLWHRIGLVTLGILLVAFLALASDLWLTVANNAMIAIVGAVAMMILTGFAGQVSLGHAAFLAVGAYTVAIGSGTFGLPIWLSMPLAGVVATLVGLLVGPFALRLEGLYLAVVTIGLLFLVELALRNGLSLAYGKDYLNVPINLGFGVPAGGELGPFRTISELGGWTLRPDHKLFLLFVPLTTVTIWIGHNIGRSNLGRAMMAVRDRDMAAAALGVDPAATKLVAFGISSFLAGVAGAMYACSHPVLTLEPFSLKMSVEFVAMVVLGGIGTIFGAVWGALAYTMLLPLAEQLGAILPFPNGFTSEHQSVLLFFPALCAFLVFEPLGLFGVWLRIKRYFLAWPFKY
jgi:branched-chain amino acid transport system permease protein